MAYVTELAACPAKVGPFAGPGDLISAAAGRRARLRGNYRYHRGVIMFEYQWWGSRSAGCRQYCGRHGPGNDDGRWVAGGGGGGREAPGRCEYPVGGQESPPASSKEEPILISYHCVVTRRETVSVARVWQSHCSARDVLQLKCMCI